MWHNVSTSNNTLSVNLYGMLRKVILGYVINLQKPRAKESQMEFRFKSSSGSSGVIEGYICNLA